MNLNHFNNRENIFSQNNTKNTSSDINEQLISGMFVKIFCNFSFFFTGIFILPAVIFNILILHVMIVSGTGTTETTRAYYIVMAFGELGTVILKDVIRYWLGVGWPSVILINPLGSLNLHHKGIGSEIVCPIVYFFSYSHELMANFTMVLFGIERVFALYAPIRVHVIFTFNRSLCILCSLLVIVLLFCSTIFMFVRDQKYDDLPMQPQTLCLFSQDEGIWSWFGKILLFCNYFCPALLSFICSALIAMKLVRRHTLNKRSISTVSLMTDLQFRRTATAHPAPALALSSSPISCNEISVSITLLLISSLHVLFYFPLAVLRITYLVLPAFIIQENQSNSRIIPLEVH